jgi:hypothetical protein
MASLGPNGSIQTAAIGIDDCLSLQRDSIAQPVEQALDQAGDRLPVVISI